jgi:hypothetical protein
MPIWATQKLPISEWGAVQFRLAVAQLEMRLALHLAMLRWPAPLDQPDDVYILLPDETLMQRFPGFTQIAENEIPEGVSMLLGEKLGFAKRFPETAAKIRPDLNGVDDGIWTQGQEPDVSGNFADR